MDGRLTPLQFPVAAPPRPGETLAAASGVWWLRMQLPFVLDHINLWLLEDGPGWTIVDTGYVKCRLGRHLVKQQSSIGFNAAAAVRGLVSALCGCGERPRSDPGQHWPVAHRREAVEPRAEACPRPRVLLYKVNSVAEE
jgi:hypothetical protein